MKINCEYTELVDLHKLIENPKNANKHSKEQIERLAKLLDFQGWRHPIIVSKRSGFVVAGHGRLLAAKHLGWTQAPVDYQDFETEATEYAFLVSDNEIARWAELDEEKLMQDLQDLDLGDIDLLGLEKIPSLEIEEIESDEEKPEEFILQVTVPTLQDLEELESEISAKGYLAVRK